MTDLETKLKGPIECLIAYHEQEAKNHVSSQWIYSNHMFAVNAYKKVLKMFDDSQPSVQAEGQAGGVLAVEQIRDAHRATMSESLDFQDSYFYRRLTERLNAAILATAPRSPSTPIVPSTPVKTSVRYCGHEVQIGLKCPECYTGPSFVPGTAGLSAEQVQASDGLNAVLA